MGRIDRVVYQILKPFEPSSGWVSRWVYRGEGLWWTGYGWSRDRNEARRIIGWRFAFNELHALPEPGPRTTYLLIYADRSVDRGFQVDTERLV